MRAYLGLGSNLGDREQLLRDALSLIQTEGIGTVVSLSSFYETAPWGFSSTHAFLNAAACIDTTLSPEALMTATQRIERRLGRLHKSVNKAYHDRPIDIDILLCDDTVLHTGTLTIPHPEMTQRLFVMEPLAEIAPTLRHPLIGRTMQDLLEALKRKGI